jgi:hypothetical protein
MDSWLIRGILLLWMGLICFGAVTWWLVGAVSDFQLRQDRDKRLLTSAYDRLETIEEQLTENENALLMLLRRDSQKNSEQFSPDHNPFSDLPIAAA